MANGWTRLAGVIDALAITLVGNLPPKWDIRLDIAHKWLLSRIFDPTVASLRGSGGLLFVPTIIGDATWGRLLSAATGWAVFKKPVSCFASGSRPSLANRAPFDLDSSDIASLGMRPIVTVGIHSRVPGPAAAAANGTIDGQCSLTASTRNRNATSTAISVTGKKVWLDFSCTAMTA